MEALIIRRNKTRQIPIFVVKDKLIFMPDAVSKEMLKSALVELAQSEREFFIALLSDTLAYALALPDASPSTPIKPKSRRKPLPAKVEPAYRRDPSLLRQQYAIDKSALLSLRELFADAPPAEAIIATLAK